VHEHINIYSIFVLHFQQNPHIMIWSEQIDSKTGTRGLQQLAIHPIKYINWRETCNIKADFSIANDRNNIYLRYRVAEKNVIGSYQEINDPVFRDSCVEFFISFGDKPYYNFEFNCIGNVLAQYGRDRNERTYLRKDLLQEIATDPSLGRNKIRIINRDIQWALDIALPIKVFHYTQVDDLTALTVTCNFYKCGDDLPEPHYLSWRPVNSPVPDFHRPESFEELTFI